MPNIVIWLFGFITGGSIVALLFAIRKLEGKLTKHGRGNSGVERHGESGLSTAFHRCQRL